MCFLLRYHSNNTWIAQPTNGLSHNNFNSDTNAIPSLFCNLGNLNSLRLMRSYLSGSIPTCLGKSLFTTLDLLYNKLTIPIHPFSNPKPPTHVIFLIFYVVTYQAVILSNNHLTCPTPNNYAKLISISQLDLGGNRLSGTIPDFISQWQLWGQLDLWGYMFISEFHVPKDYFAHTNLCITWIYHITISTIMSYCFYLIFIAHGSIGLETIHIGKNLFYGPLQLDFSLFMSLR